MQTRPLQRRENRNHIPRLRARRLVRRLPHQVQENSTLLNLDLLLGCAVGRAVLGDHLDLDAIHAADELGFVDGLALFLAAFVTGAGARAVDARCDGDAIYLERLVAVHCDEEAVEARGEGDGDFGCDLEIRVGGRDDDGGAVRRFLLAGEHIDGPGLGEVEGGVCVECYLGYQSFIYACCKSADGRDRDGYNKLLTL
jgi:hypothetical protein